MKKSVVSAVVGMLALTALTGCEQEISRYETTWEHEAHRLQRELDANQPLPRATFLGTHNAYNSHAYTTPQSYLDPNQTHTLTNQLRMDIRALELDVHTFNTYDLSTGALGVDLLLCHGLDTHVGCSPWDRPFTEGLQEIADWLAQPENQHEVLMVYIEDHMNDDHYDRAIDALQSTVAPYIYMPQSSGCNGIPATLTKNQVRASGKNIVLISDGCNNSDFNRFVFGGFENGPGGYPTAGVADLMEAPHCLEGRYSVAQMDSLFIRIQEDRTMLSNLVGAAGPKVTPEVIARMLDCGVNLPGMDKLRPFDGRLQAAIWSWATNEPTNAAGFDCAYHASEGRFAADGCTEQRYFACRDDDTGNWFISPNTGSWEQGFASCEAAGMRFTVPYSGQDNLRLTQLKATQGVENLWLGYRRNTGDEWQVYE